MIELQKALMMYGQIVLIGASLCAACAMLAYFVGKFIGKE